MSPTRRSLFERTLDALPDGVLLTDRDRRVLYTNQAFSELWSIPAALLDSRDEAAMLRHVRDQLLDPDAFLREVERIHPTDENSTDELLFRDGRVISRRSVAFQDDEQFAARIWIFTDITEVRFARFDALTGLKNRRAFDDEFPIFLSSDTTAWKTVALLDVDNFKKYNDVYGHAAGDAVLRSIGEILRKHLAEADDLLFRIGGEEFLMGLRTNTEPEAWCFFDAVREGVAELNIPHSGNGPHGIVTASIGTDTFRGAASSSSAFSRADAALYQAKARGRNLVTRSNGNLVVELPAPSAGATGRRRFRGMHATG